MSFMVTLSLFAAGAIGALLAQRKDALANGASASFAIAGSLSGLVFSIATLITGSTVSFAMPSLFPLLSLSVHVDALSAFFIFIISLIALFCSIYSIGYVKHFYKKNNIGSLGFFYNIFIMI
jgi:hydrogenase-4 component B